MTTTTGGTTTSKGAYSVLYCRAWDFGLGEPWEGGRCLEEAATLAEAEAAALDYAPAARRLWGPGRIYLTDWLHRLVCVLDPERPGNPIRMAPAEVAEAAEAVEA